MMKLRTIAMLVSIAFLGSCSSISVTADWDKTVDFNSYKTYSYYGWAKESDKILNSFDKERIEEAFANEFNRRGMQYVESGGDLVVALFIVIDQKTGVTAYTDHYGAGSYGYYSPWGWGSGYSTTSYHEYDYLVGTLVCDVFDHSTKKLIWQGVGSGIVDDNPNKRDRNIPKSVAQIMNYYRVQPIK